MKSAAPLMLSLSLALLFGLLPQASAASYSTAAIRPPFNQPARVAARVRFVKRLVKEKNTRRKYTVEASYPQIVGAKDARALQFNRAVRELLMGAVNDFKKNAGPPDADIPKEVQWSSFDAGYTIEYNNADLISINFGVSNYYAGAAHPLPYSMVFNYDLKTGRTLSLSDLFKPRSTYTQLISAYAIKELVKELGEDADREWIERGAAPDSKNFESWNITKGGLSITFDAYQVAAYAYGPQTVLIPYAELHSVINPDGPLGKVKR